MLNRRKTTSFNFTLEAAWKKAVVLPYWALHSRNLAVRSDQSCTWEMSSHFDTTDHKVLQVLTLPYHPAFKDFPRIWGASDDRFCGLILIWLLTFGVQRVIRRESKTDSYSKGPTLFGLPCILCHNFWTNYDLDLFSTSKWPSDLQFCERYKGRCRKND